jgi:hypothetical protein
MDVDKKCDLKYGRMLYRGVSYNEIISMLSSGMIAFNSEISLAEKPPWQPLLQFNDFPSFVTHKLLIAANSHSYDSLFNHWYVKDRDNSFGPFSLLQMLEFFIQNRIELEHLIRHSSFSDWEKMGQSGPFELKSLENLLSCQPINNIISRRRHPRVKYDNEVFISSGGELYRGVSWSLSTGGLGIVTDQSTKIQLDDKVNVIINSNQEHGAVQIKGRIVSLQKEMNFERVAMQFETKNDFLDRYIDSRIPK